MNRRWAPVTARCTHLEAAKKILGHGVFGTYCGEEMAISGRTALNYMNLAKLARTRDPNDLAKLSPGAGYELAAKNAPESVVSEVLADVRAGRAVTENEVKQRISAAKGSQEKEVPIPDADEIADLLTAELSPCDIDHVEHFLRSAKTTTIKYLCDRLQKALTDVATTASDRLPKNRLV